MSDTLLFTINEEKKYAAITLNRPAVLNSFNREMAFALQAALDECAANDAVRAVYITGSGKAFSAGQDLAEVNEVPLPTILQEHYNPIVSRLRALPKPVVCGVNGVAAGAGANLALACDIVIARRSASFIQAFSKIGLIPDSGGTYFLPRLVGFAKAAAFMMLGERVSAQEAERLGMIYKVAEDDAFDSETRSITEQLAAMPTRALAFTKAALNASLTQNLEQQLVLEDRLQTQAAQTYDYQEGVTAFLEKRPPVFLGK